MRAQTISDHMYDNIVMVKSVKCGKRKGCGTRSDDISCRIMILKKSIN